MAMKLKIKKGATVQVTTGKDKGKKGTVLEIVASKMGLRVQGIRMQRHYNKESGFQDKEGLIHYSNVKLLDAPAAPKAKVKSKSTKASKTAKA